MSPKSQIQNSPFVLINNTPNLRNSEEHIFTKPTSFFKTPTQNTQNTQKSQRTQKNSLNNKLSQVIQSSPFFLAQDMQQTQVSQSVLPLSPPDDSDQGIWVTQK